MMKHEYNPDRKWTWIDCYDYTPEGKAIGQDIIMSEKEILDEYYTYWSKGMIEKFGAEHFEEHYTFGDCVDCYIVTHWATEYKDGKVYH